MAFADAHVPGWVDAVKEQYGQPTTRYACVGYCFGAPYVCNELAKATVSVGAFAHPAFLKESHFHKVKSELHLYPSNPNAGTNDVIRAIVPLMRRGGSHIRPAVKTQSTGYPPVWSEDVAAAIILRCRAWLCPQGRP